jgi:hypothetical protein
MKKLGKAFLVFLISSFFCFSLYARESNIRWFTPGAPDLSAQWGYSLPFRGDLRNPAPSEDFILAADYGELRLKSGIKYQCNQLDLTNTFIYMPTFFDVFQAGVGINWHFYRYVKEFTENDLTFTGRFRWIRGPVFSFENSLGFLFKFASIDAIRQNQPCIFNFSYQHELLLNWHIFNRADLWFALNLQDYFDYPLAISPFYKFGFDFEAVPGIVLGMDYTMKFVDMFYSAVYMNESILRFTFKVEI